MENAQTGLKSSRPPDRADYLHTGTNPERDECEHIHFNPVSAAPSASEQHMLDKALKKTMAGKGIKSKDIVPVSCEDVENFGFVERYRTGFM